MPAQRYPILLILFSCFFLSESAEPTQSKFRVCTITLNSSDEKDVFKKYLPDKNFEFTELVPQESASSTGSKDWFKAACKSQVRCDVLIISGHFGGRFFGSSGYTLGLEDLEQHSCVDDCSGILNHPKEVFLFGCNTLSGKDPDGRTPQQYLEVLLQDGFSQADAERIVESRYGPYGSANKDRMQRVFTSVPDIHGFNSKGPSGKTVRPLLEKYLKKTGNYYSHLLQRSTAALTEFLDFNRNQNPILANALSDSAYGSCRGLRPEDSGYAIKKTLCDFYSPDIRVADALTRIEHQMKQTNFLAFAGTFSRFFDKHSPSEYNEEERAIFQRIQTIPEAKTLVLEYVNKIHTPALRYEVTRFAETLGYISPKRGQEIRWEILKPLLQFPPAQRTVDLLCGELSGIGAQITSAQVDPRFYESETGLTVLGCVEPKDPAIHASVASQATNPDRDRRIKALNVLENLKPQDSTIHVQIAKALDAQDAGTQEAALATLKRTQSNDATIHRKLAAKLTSKNSDVRTTAAFAIRELRPSDPIAQLAIADFVVTEQNRGGRAEASRALKEAHHISPEAWKRLVEGVSKGDEDLKIRFLEIIEQQKPKNRELQLEVVKLLSDQSRRISDISQDVIRSIRPKDKAVLDRIRSINPNVIDW